VAKRERLNNFQRQETARWLLNISQASAVGGVGSLFVPGIGEKIGLWIAFISLILAVCLFVYMYSLCILEGK